jgi:short subunit dehydrogenase-like uncharacterized protein
MGRTLDLVLFGASGFTGRLVAEYLQRRLSSPVDLRWALAGRDAAKLAQVRDAIGADPGLPLGAQVACRRSAARWPPAAVARAPRR